MLMNIINRFAAPIIQIAELLAYYSKNYSRIFCPSLVYRSDSWCAIGDSFVTAYASIDSSPETNPTQVPWPTDA